MDRVNTAIKSMPIAIIDRDGTIIRDYPDDVWSLQSTPEFLPGALAALRSLVDRGFGVVIVTNQYLIGEGFITLCHYQAFAQKVQLRLDLEEIHIVGTYFCPHRRTAPCDCSKPGRGLVDRALHEHRELTLDGGLVVGDSPCDVGLGVALGLQTFGIGPRCVGEPGVTIATSLLDAVNLALIDRES